MIDSSWRVEAELMPQVYQEQVSLKKMMKETSMEVESTWMIVG
jgi:hypothetical protein